MSGGYSSASAAVLVPVLKKVVERLYQRCHLIHDLAHHRWQRRMTLRLRWALGDLFSGLYSRAGYPKNGVS